MRSSGKVTLFSVSITPVPTAALSLCAERLVVSAPDVKASKASNHPVFFMLPPKFAPRNRLRRGTPNSLPQKGLPSKVTPWVQGGQGYDGIGHALPFGKMPGK